MKTKEIAPWNLRAGMKIAVYSYGNVLRAYHVTNVCKYRSRFTGAMAWRVRYKDELSSLGYSEVTYHGKGRGLYGLPLEKVKIALDV